MRHLFFSCLFCTFEDWLPTESVGLNSSGVLFLADLVQNFIIIGCQKICLKFQPCTTFVEQQQLGSFTISVPFLKLVLRITNEISVKLVPSLVGRSEGAKEIEVFRTAPNWTTCFKYKKFWLNNLFSLFLGMMYI